MKIPFIFLKWKHLIEMYPYHIEFGEYRGNSSLAKNFSNSLVYSMPPTLLHPVSFHIVWNGMKLMDSTLFTSIY